MSDDHLLDVLEVLTGGRRLPFDGPPSKALRLMLGVADTDTVITRERTVIHFGRQRRKHPHEYGGPFANALSELLERAGVAA